jgi:hypothetical protein
MSAPESIPLDVEWGTRLLYALFVSSVHFSHVSRGLTYWRIFPLRGFSQSGTVPCSCFRDPEWVKQSYAGSGCFEKVDVLTAQQHSVHSLGSQCLWLARCKHPLLGLLSGVLVFARLHVSPSGSIFIIWSFPVFALVFFFFFFLNWTLQACSHSRKTSEMGKLCYLR